MDLALTYNPTLQAFDLSLAGADLAAEDTLASTVLTSLLCDRLAQGYEITTGQDQRGWWADAFTETPHKTGSRLWLLEREKQLPATVRRCQQYCQEALQWLVDDGLASAVSVTAFVPRTGWLVALIKVTVNNQARNFRFEFNQAVQMWRLGGESF
jgi:phage gp46-like protein